MIDLYDLFGSWADQTIILRGIELNYDLSVKHIAFMLEVPHKQEKETPSSSTTESPKNTSTPGSPKPDIPSKYWDKAFKAMSANI